MKRASVSRASSTGAGAVTRYSNDTSPFEKQQVVRLVLRPFFLISDSIF